MWYVIECPYCGLPQIVRADQKYRTCFKCRKRILIDPKKVNIIYRSNNVKEITYVLLRLKEGRFKIK